MTFLMTWPFRDSKWNADQVTVAKKQQVLYLEEEKEEDDIWIANHYGQEKKLLRGTMQILNRRVNIEMTPRMEKTWETIELLKK